MKTTLRIVVAVVSCAAASATYSQEFQQSHPIPPKTQTYTTTVDRGTSGQISGLPWSGGYQCTSSVESISLNSPCGTLVNFTQGAGSLRGVSGQLCTDDGFLYEVTIMISSDQDSCQFDVRFDRLLKFE